MCSHDGCEKTTGCVFCLFIVLYLIYVLVFVLPPFVSFAIFLLLMISCVMIIINEKRNKTIEESRVVEIPQIVVETY